MPLSIFISDINLKFKELENLIIFAIIKIIIKHVIIIVKSKKEIPIMVIINQEIIIIIIIKINRLKTILKCQNCGRFDHFSDERKSNNNYYNNNKSNKIAKTLQLQ